MDPVASAEPTEGRCGALIRKGDNAGMYCTKPPMTAQTRCGSHGAKAKQNLAAAERRQQSAAMEQAVLTFGLPLDISPEEALLREVQNTAGHCAWLLARVQELSPEALVWGRTSEVSKEATEFPGVDTTREAIPNVWLTLYERYQKHLLAVIDVALKHKIEERRVRLAEAEGAKVAEVLRGALLDLAQLLAAGTITTVDPSDPTVLRVVGTRLRALTAGDAA